MKAQVKTQIMGEENRSEKIYGHYGLPQAIIKEKIKDEHNNKFTP